MSAQRAKRLLLVLLIFLKKNAAVMLICAFLFLFYLPIIGESATWIMVLLLLGYANVMAANSYAKAKRAKLEKSNALTAKKLIGLSALTFAPIYACWILLSILPLPTVGGWLIVQIPLVAVSGVLLYGSAYNWNAVPRRIWWGLQPLIYAASLLVGQLLGRLIFP